MTTEHNDQDSSHWREADLTYSPILREAQKMGHLIEQTGGMIYDIKPGKNELSWADLVQAFADAADATVEQYIRQQREKAAYIDAQRDASDQPEEAQETPHHICARFMIIAFFDGSDFQIDFRDPTAARGWAVRNIRGVDMLVVGHGVPRKMFPLKNIRYFDLIPEENL